MEDNNFIINGFKTVTTTGVLGYVGFKFGNLYKRNIENIKSMVDFQQKQYNKFESLVEESIHDTDIINNEYFWLSDYDVGANEPSKININQTYEDYFSSRLEHEAEEAMESLEKVIDTKTTQKIEDLSYLISGETSMDEVKIKNLSKEYPSLITGLDKQNINISNIRESFDKFSFDIIKDGKQKRMTIPRLNGNNLMVDGSLYSVNRVGTIADQGILLHSSKSIVNKSIEQKLHLSQLSQSGVLNELDKISNSIKSAFNVATYERRNSNDLSDVFSFELDEMSLASKYAGVDKNIKDVLAEVSSQVHGRAVFETTDKGELRFTGKYADVSATGEASKKIGTRGGIMNSYITDTRKQDPRRLNMAYGQILQKGSYDDIAGKLGFTFDFHKDMVDTMRETIPGGMHSIMFYDTNLLAEGEMTYLLRSTSDVNTNIDTIKGSVEKSLKLNLTDNPVLDEIEKIVTSTPNTKFPVIPKGIIKGYDDKGKSVSIDDDINILNISQDGQYAKITYRTPQQQGDFKFTKARNSGFSTQEEYGKSLYDKNDTFGEVIKKATGKQHIDIMMHTDLLSKYSGGIKGQGFMHQVLTDVMHNTINKGKIKSDKDRKKLSRQLKDIAGIMFGQDNIDNTVDSIQLSTNNDTKEKVVTVKWKDGLKIDSKDLQYFSRFDDELSNLNTPNYGETIGRLRTIQDNLNQYGMQNDIDILKDYKVIGQTGEKLNTIPNFLVNVGDEKADIVGARLSIFEFAHKVGMDKFTRYGSNLGKGGIKVNIDTMLNSIYSSSPIFRKYLLMQTMGRNREYFRSRLHADTGELLEYGDIESAKEGEVLSMSPMGLKRDVRLITQDKLKKSKLYKLLLEDAKDTKQVRELINKRLTDGSIGDTDLESIMDRELIESLYGNVDDLSAETKRGESLYFMKKNTVADVIDELNSTSNDYLNIELPFKATAKTVDGSVRDIHALPIYRISAEDVFNMSVGEYLKDNGTKEIVGKVKGSYVTGKTDVTNILSTLSNIADITERYDKDSTPQEKHNIQNELNLTIEKYYTNLRKSAVGKRSSYSEKLTTGRMPFSFAGKYTPDSSLKLGEVGITADDFVKVITQGKVDNTTEANKVINRYKAINKKLGKEKKSVFNIKKELGWPEVKLNEIKNNVNSDIDKKLKAIKSSEKTIEKLNSKAAAMDKKLKLSNFALDTLEKVQNDSPMEAHLIRNPDLSTGSSLDVMLKIVNHSKVSTKANDLLKNNKNRKEMKSAIKHSLYMNELTAALEGGDFDGDIGNLIVKSLDSVREQAEKFNVVTDIFGDTGISKPFGKLLEDEASVDRIKRFLMYEKDNILRPTNSTGFSILQAVNQEADNVNVVKKKLFDYVKDNFKDLNMTKHKTPNDLYNHIKDTLSLKDKDYFVVTDIKQKDKSYDSQKISKEVLGLTPSQHDQYMKEISQNKEEYHDYKQKLEKNMSKRIREMKTKTPEAFNSAKALQELAFLSFNEEEKIFMTAFADKTVAQLTISTKKGTPNVLDDIINTLKKYQDPKAVVTEKDLDKLARGNWKPEFSKTHLEQMKSLGFEGENMDFDDYEKFLNKKHDYLNKALDIHKDAEKMLKDDIISGRNSEYHKVLKKTINKFTKDKYIKDVDVSVKEIVFHEIEETQKEIKNAGKYRIDKFLLYDASKPADARVNYNYRKKNFKSMLRNIKQYRMSTGQYLFENKSMKPIRGFKSDPTKTTIVESIKNVVSEFTDNSYTTANPYNMVYAQAAGNITGQTNVTFTPNTVEKRRLYSRLQQIEKSTIRQVTDDVIQNSSSHFGERSIMDKLANKSRSALDKTGVEVDRLISGKRGMKAAVALLAGSFMGQAINSITNGYSAIGLNDTEGYGGEYYENQSGIIRSLVGSTPEVLKQRKRVRAVNGYKESIRGMQSVINELDGNAFYGSRPTNQRQYKRQYRGVSV